MYNDLQVSVHAIVLGSSTLARYSEYHVVVDAGWDRELYDFLALYDSVATTFMTFVLDDVTLAMTSRAGALGLHHAKHGARGTNRVARTMASWASFRLGASLASCAMTFVANHILANLEFLGKTLVSFLQGKFYCYTQVSSLVLWSLGLSTSKTAESATVSTEDVAEHGEDVVHVHAGTTSESSESTLWTIESKLVVLLTLLRVAKHIIGLCGLLEFFLCLLVARVAVWVIFDGYLAISLLDLVFRCRLVYAEHLVIVSLCHCLFPIL